MNYDILFFGVYLFVMIGLVLRFPWLMGNGNAGSPGGPDSGCGGDGGGD